jgi:peptidoglycan hydrolase-like protein with peptidoglycan-binding domain
MTKVRHLSALVAVSALLGLAACGNGNTEAQAAQAAAPPPPAPAPAPAPPPPATPTVVPAVTPHVVREVQTVLRNAGSYHLTVDGRDGPATRLAVRRWQRDHNLRSTGIIDPATLQSMNITS